MKPIKEPEDVPYPASYVNWAYVIFGQIVELIDQFAPDILVIEETVAGSKSVYSQKILEYTHFLVARLIRDTGMQVRYFLTGEWRVITGCLMTKAEKARNKAIKVYKETHGTKLARNAEGKVVGKISKKHVNVRRANEVFGDMLSKPLIKKDEDTADALLLAYAYHVLRVRSL